MRRTHTSWRESATDDQPADLPHVIAGESTGTTTQDTSRPRLAPKRGPATCITSQAGRHMSGGGPRTPRSKQYACQVTDISHGSEGPEIPIPLCRKSTSATHISILRQHKQYERISLQTLLSSRTLSDARIDAAIPYGGTCGYPQTDGRESQLHAQLG